MEDFSFSKEILLVEKDKIVINLWRKKLFVVFKILEEFDYESVISVVFENLVGSNNFVDGVFLCVR